MNRRCNPGRALRRAVVGLLVSICLPINAQAGDKPGAILDAKADHRYPPCKFVVDVTKAPYSAKGDGKTDDTAALQKAINENMGQHRTLYLPNGTYLVSATLKWTNRISKDRQAWGFNCIAGQNPTRTIIRLKDNTFPRTGPPGAIMWCGGFGSADWFHNYVQDLTFDVGRGNDGATGLEFYSNNTGAVRNVAITSADGKGRIGLDLGHRDMNGPLLVSNVVVRGFQIGIRTAGAVNSQTFERISLAGQTKFGLVNAGQSVSIRRLLSQNAVPALRAGSPTALLDSELTGTGEARERPAMEVVTDAFYCRNVTTSGYKAAVVNDKQRPPVKGAKVEEWIAGKATSPFGGPTRSLKLAAEETPEVPWDDPKTWAVVDTFGADPTGGKDSSDAIQRAIDSGATTVFFPGFYSLEKPVTVRGKARRLLGTGAWIDYTSKSKPDLIIADGDAKEVAIEHFASIHGGIEVRTDRTVVLRSLESHRIANKGKGKLFLEDVASSDVRVGPDQRVWARQLNVENQGTHLSNDGGKLWVLGYKTERGGTLLHSKNGGRSEIFGNLSYTTTAGKLAPMFVTEDASVFAFFHEVCFNGDPFATLIRESRKGVVREVRRGGGGISPYVGSPGKNDGAGR